MINMKLEIYKHQGRVNLNYAYIFVWVISIYPLDYLSKVMPDICCSLNIAFSLKRKKYEQKKVGILHHVGKRIFTSQIRWGNEH